MDIDAAKLALEAARAAGAVGSIAWDKLCLYYRVEAMVSLVGLLTLTMTGVRLVILAHGKEFFVREGHGEPKQTRHLWVWLAGCALMLGSTLIGLTSGARLFAQSVVPEVRAAVAVHDVIRNRGGK